jgi:nitrous oxidase accessory protein NosD
MKTYFPKTITVPDDYPTIQAAIDNASPSDTVFVRNGIYRETIIINKALTLIGENPNNTIIIRPKSYQTYLQPAISVNIGNVAISRLTVKDSHAGIAILSDSGESIVISCNLLNNTYGIYAEGTLSYVKATGEYIPQGTSLSVSGNYIAGNEFGLSASNGNITLYNNTIVNNGNALSFWHVTFNVSNNLIANNIGWGIEFAPGCKNSLVYENVFEQNGVGIQLNRFPIDEVYTIGSGNVVYRNNFINNIQQAGEVFQYDFNFPNNGTDIVAWDNDKEGNYWSDYEHRYPNAEEMDGTGTWDTRYIIDKNNQDNYPLMNPVTIPKILLP